MISAVDKLRRLRAGESERGRVAVSPNGAIAPELTLDTLPPEWRVEWEERAAIREYDGGQAREHAEAEALREIIDRMRAAGHPI